MKFDVVVALHEQPEPAVTLAAPVCAAESKLSLPAAL
jgi:hypothetical protein